MKLLNKVIKQIIKIIKIIKLLNKLLKIIKQKWLILCQIWFNV